MTWFLISAVIAALILAGEGVWTWHTHRQLSDAPTEVLWEDTATFPTLPPVPGADSWSAQVGFNPWAAWLDARHAAVFDAEPSIFTALAAQFAPALAAIEARRPLELTGAQA